MRRHIYDHQSARLRPAIDSKCWLDYDLQFWLTGEYDMSEESPDVQTMLDLASMLNAARVEWLMAGIRQASHCSPHLSTEREPRHVVGPGSARRGYDVQKD